MPSCSAPFCSFRSSGRKSKKQVEYERMHGKVRFHRIPKDPIRRPQWIQAVGRINWTPSPNAAICSRHFRPGDEIFKRNTTLKNDVVPSIFSPVDLGEKCEKPKKTSNDKELSSVGKSKPTSGLRTPKSVRKASSQSKESTSEEKSGEHSESESAEEKFAEVMLNRYVAFKSNALTDLKEIKRRFKRYGSIESVINPEEADLVIVVFRSVGEVRRCVRNYKMLQDKYGLTIIRAKIPDDYMDMVEFEMHRGVDNPELPSLMHLNDDCLLHILQYLPNEYLLGDVCMRMRRLCKSKEKINHFNGSEVIDIFHYGPLFSHVTLDALPIDENLLDLISLRCVNMKFLSLEFYMLCVNERKKNTNFQTLRKIMPSLRELVLDQIDFKVNDRSDNFKLAIGLLLIDAKSGNMRKIRMTFMWDLPPRSEYNCFFMQLTSLTVLIIPKFVIDIGEILIELPNLRVLACVLIQSEEYPTKHELRDFYGFAICPDWKLVILELSKVCPNLRNLRVCGDSEYTDLMTIFPNLEGLFLEGFSTKDGVFHLPGGEKLKTFIFDVLDCRRSGDFSRVVTEFLKLEILHWNEMIHGDIFENLNLRPSNQLTIVTNSWLTEEGRKKKEKYPHVKWVNRLTDVFGPFSIFSVPATHHRYVTKFKRAFWG